MVLGTNHNKNGNDTNSYHNNSLAIRKQRNGIMGIEHFLKMEFQLHEKLNYHER